MAPPSQNIITVKRLKPAHLLVIRLFWAGETYVDIAQKTGYTPQHVMNIVKSDEAQEILQQLQNTSLDSMDEIHEALNDAAPEILSEQIRLALRSPDERIRATVGRELLHMAGHAPVKRVTLDRASDVHKKYEGLTEEQLRDKLINELGGVGGSVGPDGRPLS